MKFLKMFLMISMIVGLSATSPDKCIDIDCLRSVDCPYMQS